MPQGLERFLRVLLDDDAAQETVPSEAAGEIYFSPVVCPLATYGKAELLAALQAVPAGTRAFDAAILAGQLTRPLLAVLDHMVLRTLVAELKRDRLAGRLHAAGPEERFAGFVEGFGCAERRRELFGRYPVLARQLAVETHDWLECWTRFAGHAAADRECLADTFAGGGDPGTIVECRPGLGDRHRGGSVALVRWADGTEVVYKPRSLSSDAQFQRFLSWANGKGLSHRLRTMTCLDRGDHGWTEVVTAGACDGEGAWRRFYHRQGSLLALLYVLGANDMHAENLIAAGEHPVVVDLETLNQPGGLPGGIRAETEADAAAGEAAANSVLTVGLLPRRVPGSRQGGPADLSGLGWTPGQRGPLPVPVIRDPRTDTMRVELAAPMLPMPAHVPRGDPSVRVLDHAADVIAGFTQAYTLCQDHRAELIGTQLAGFADGRTRVVVRGTAWYAAVLRMAFHPDVLRDGLDRDALFDRVWRDELGTPVKAACAEHERADLWRNAIPIFTTQAASAVLLNSEHQPVVGLTLMPGLARTRSRLAGLGPDDLARQTWLITAALGTTATSETVAAEGAHPVSPAATARRGTVDLLPLATPAQLISAADAIGRRLAEIAFERAGSAQWLGINSAYGANWSVGPLKADLYHGLTGIALFLAHLGRLTGDPAHTKLAKRALNTALTQLDNDPPLRYAGMSGTGGIVYALASLGELWSDEPLIDAAGRQALRAARLASDDTIYDFTGGSAGSIAGLLALHKLRPSPRLAAQIRACADRLLATATPASSIPGSSGTGIGWLSADLGQFDGAIAPVPGFAHGNAGIAVALSAAADLLNDHRYQDAARQAIAYEQALFDHDVGTWDDSRCYPGRARTRQASRSPSWCRGAAGIGISRLICLPQAPDPALARREIDSALLAVSQNNPMTQCLCHGGTGTLELYLQAALTLAQPGWHDTAARHCTRLLTSIAKHGYRCGTPLDTQTPGLLVGLAGIGYGLLRVVDPGHIPAALTLQPAAQPASTPPASTPPAVPSGNNSQRR